MLNLTANFERSLTELTYFQAFPCMD